MRAHLALAQEERQAPSALPAPAACAHRPLSVASALALQRAAGNRALAALVRPSRPASETDESLVPLETAEAEPPSNIQTPTDESPPPPERSAPTEAELLAGGSEPEPEFVAGGSEQAAEPADTAEPAESPAEIGLEPHSLIRRAVAARRAAVARSNGGGASAPAAPKVGVKGVLTPQDSFTARSKTRFGVGERVDLSFTAKPAATAASLGGLRWSVTSGPATVASATDGTGTLTCGDRAGTVKLSLKVVAGANAGKEKATASLKVVEPSNARMVRKPGTGFRHNSGSADVGFQGEVFLRPKDVSFQWMEWREGTVNAVATGSFKHWNAIVHAVGSWMTTGAGNSSTGNKVNTFDSVYTGQLSPPFAKGDFQWNIPWEFRANGGTAKEFTKALHHATCDKKGRATIGKKGAGPFSRKPSDPTSTY